MVYIGFTISSNSQKYWSNKVKKSDGRFISGRLDAATSTISYHDNSRLVKEIHLHIELWTLLGEPMEKYLFRWIRGNSVMASDYTTLDEELLKKYPDLLRRFRGLRPSNIELKYQVSTTLNPKYTDVKDLNVCGEKFYNNMKVTKGASWGTNSGAVGERNINSRAHFFITRAGRTGDEIVPHSPKDWRGFIIWFSNPTAGNKQLYNTFRYASEMEFYGVEVTKMEVPNAEIDAIAKEYKRREEQSDNEQSDREYAEQEDKSKDEDKSYDPWSDNTNEPEQSENKSFNSLNSDTKSKKYSSSDIEKGYKIVEKNNKWGVISTSTGKTLFPYQKNEILEFKASENIVKVKRILGNDHIKGICKKRSGIEISEYEVGFIDKSLDWLTSESKKVKIRGYYQERKNLLKLVRNSSGSSNRSSSGRYRKRQNNKLSCKQLINKRIDKLRYKYKSDGYVTDVYINKAF